HVQCQPPVERPVVLAVVVAAQAARAAGAARPRVTGFLVAACQVSTSGRDDALEAVSAAQLDRKAGSVVQSVCHEDPVGEDPGTPDWLQPDLQLLLVDVEGRLARATEDVR